jgi:hypothetical protein
MLQVLNFSDDENVDQNVVLYDEIHYKAMWPKWLTYVQLCDGYGALFPLIPSTLRNEDYRRLWFLAGIRVTIPDIWGGCANAVQRLDLYEGLLLVYLMNMGFPDRRA